MQIKENTKANPRVLRTYFFQLDNASQRKTIAKR